MFEEYPELTPSFLEQWTPIEDEYYSVHTVLNGQPQRKVMATSLFCAHPFALFPGHRDIPDHSKGSTWWIRYVDKLCTSLAYFDTYYYFQDWKVRIYLDPNLLHLQPILQTHTKRVEFYVMKKSSVGHNPGALWRFLAMEDCNIDMGCIFDCDEHVQITLPCIDTFSKNPKMGVGRFMPQCVASIPEGGQRIHTPICAYIVCFRPSLLQLPIHRLIMQYIAYRKSIATTDKPWYYPGMTEQTPYTRSYGLDHMYGWGNYWYGYGFDERFLKHIIYPYSVRKGILQSWIFQPLELYKEPELQRDIEYTKSNSSNQLCLLFNQ